MIYSPIQIAFIKFLQNSISKNKKYGYLNLTNKEIAERFEFQKRKYSKRTIEELLIQVRAEFEFVGHTSRRFILLKNSTSITTPLTHHSHTTHTPLTHYSHSINTLTEQESLEPQGIQPPLLINKNQDQDLNLINNTPLNPPTEIPKSQGVCIDDFKLQEIKRSWLKLFAYEGNHPVKEPLCYRFLKEAFEQNWLDEALLMKKTAEYLATVKDKKYQMTPQNWLKDGMYKQEFVLKVVESSPEDEKKRIREQVDEEYRAQFGPPTGFNNTYEGEAYEHHLAWTKRRTLELKGSYPKHRQSYSLPIAELVDRMSA